MNEIKVANVIAKIALDENTYAHALRVVARSQSNEEAVVAYLHDVVEDSSATLQDLLDLGFGGYVVYAVDVLTRRENEVYADYIQRIAEGGNEMAVLVKIADLRDNLSRSDNPSKQQSLKSRYEKALALLTGRVR